MPCEKSVVRKFKKEEDRIKMNFAVIEFKHGKKVFESVPVKWIYHFDQNVFKKSSSSFVCFWSSDKTREAPVKAGTLSDFEGLKKEQFVKVFVHYLFSKLSIFHVIVIWFLFLTFFLILLI